MEKGFNQKSKYATYKLEQEIKLNKNFKAHVNNSSVPVTNISKIFNHFDIFETSLHLNAAELSINFYCDDNFSGKYLKISLR